jgi:RecB family exonuclease
LERAHRAGGVGRQGLFDDLDLAAHSSDADLEAQVEGLMEAWRGSVWLTGRYRVKAVEAPVELVFMGHAVSARIDAVFEDPSGAVAVVDWKTGASAAGAARAQHQAQVRFYQAALARRLGIDPGAIRGYVHYVPENLAVEVDHDPGFIAGLANALGGRP